MSNNQKMPHTGLRFVEWWSRRKNDSALRLLAAGIVAASLAWALDGVSAADPMFRVPVGERQLLLDDTGITRIEKLQRTMHRPDKRGAVIRPAPAQRGSLQIRHAPFWLSREQVFRCSSQTPLDPRRYCAGTPAPMACIGYPGRRQTRRL